jgi:hypothetical protein
MVIIRHFALLFLFFFGSMGQTRADSIDELGWFIVKSGVLLILQLAWHDHQRKQVDDTVEKQIILEDKKKENLKLASELQKNNPQLIQAFNERAKADTNRLIIINKDHEKFCNQKSADYNTGICKAIKYALEKQYSEMNKEYTIITRDQS